MGVKKNPEDERRYLFKSPKSRITKHDWKVEKLLIDNIDSTNNIYANPVGSPKQFSFSQVIFSFSKETYPDDMLELSFKKALDMGVYAFRPLAGWALNDKKNQLIIISGSILRNSKTFQFNAREQYFNILKLTESEFIIESIEEKRKIKLVLKAN